MEKDAPEWSPPEPFWTGWRRRREAAKDPNRYDAYPDHEEPFPELRELPVPLPQEKPKPIPHGQVYLIVAGRHHTRVVDLAGAHIDGLDFGRRMTQAWVLARILEAVNEVLALDNETDKGQSLVEYGLILALIAVVAIVGLLYLGGQIEGILNTIGSSIAGPAATP